MQLFILQLIAQKVKAALAVGVFFLAQLQLFFKVRTLEVDNFYRLSALPQLLLDTLNSVKQFPLQLINIKRNELWCLSVWTNLL